MVRPERLAIVLPDVPMSIESGLGAQVSRELPGIVIFDNDHALACGKDPGDLLAMERDDPFYIEMIDDDALVGRQFFNCFLDYSVRRSPADQRNLCPAWPKK